MTIRETMLKGKMLIEAPCSTALIDTPSLDATLLLAETLHISKENLITRGNEIMAKEDCEKFFKLLERRRSGECIAYILGRKEFRGLVFSVNPGVLVPRPDTETLAETALEFIDSLIADGKCGNNLSLLDLCTGSGALAISLKNERPFLSVSASDISREALETAALNAARLLSSETAAAAEETAILFIQSDLFENIPGKFDIILSNPPYIPSGKLSSLAPEIRREPPLALDGGKEGLELIKKIITQAANFLHPRGVLILEAGPEQMREIRQLLKTCNFRDIKIKNDLTGRDRVISANLN